MAASCYSGTSLIKKLGIKDDLRVRLVNPPDDYFQLLGKDLSSQVCPPKMYPDWVHLFAASLKEFEKGMAALQPVWAGNTGVVIWVSWYKKSAGIPTDLNENIIRDYALGNGLVDVKVCAVSDQWSGLKLVVPLKYR